jgi:hypothetical protein
LGPRGRVSRRATAFCSYHESTMESGRSFTHRAGPVVVCSGKRPRTCRRNHIDTNTSAAVWHPP